MSMHRTGEGGAVSRNGSGVVGRGRGGHGPPAKRRMVMMRSGEMRQITNSPCGHILTNTGVWSPDSKRIVYDVRSDAVGTVFDGTRIETVDVETGEIVVLYESTNGACCGVATFSPKADRVVFILGPEYPTADWQYAANHRRGAMVDCDRPGVAIPLEARDLIRPFTPGALKGGTHLHVFSPDGKRVCFTYEDALEERQRNVGVSQLGCAVSVPRTHVRNHDGSAFSRVVTRTVAKPQAGSDDISRAYEEGWIDDRQIAFVGDCVGADGSRLAEVFVVDVESMKQTRLTRTENRKFPGLCGPRHWVRSSPDGKRVAMLMKDDAGVGQLWTIDPAGGEPVQMTFGTEPIASSFTWHPSGKAIAVVIGGCVCLAGVDGSVRRLTVDVSAMAEACVVSPDGRGVAFVGRVGEWNQVWVVGV